MASGKISTRTYQIIIAVLLFALLLMSWLMFSQRSDNIDLTSENTELNEEKNELKNDLQEMLDQYDAITIENDSLNEGIIEQKERIEKLLSEVDQLNVRDKNFRWEIDKLKKENGTLRDIMKGYLVQIDSLNQANQFLTEQNENISSELQSVSTEKTRLESTVASQQDIIKTGSVLQALNLNAVAIRLKNNGNQIETSRASRAEKIRTCCTLYENKIAPKGPKNIYLRIISPDGIILSDPKNPDATFEFGGVSGKYSAKRVIEYNNDTMDNVCVYYDIPSELATGLYLVEFYDEDAIIGRAEFELR